ncbi:MAG: branched-chain amino acid ABC transporter permease [Deltaproteobacteria bacterium]|nr:branched-chain amino acid ABC transporter permease [Deltaproteobacteria bacterium]
MMTADLTPVQRERVKEHETRYRRPSFLVQLLLLSALLITPFVFPSFRIMDTVAKIVIFAVVVASYDVILGYTGSLSLAHAMFFGIGSYSLALIVYHSGAPHWYHIPLAFVVATAISSVLAVLIAFFSLRVKAIFFAMMTLALSEFAHILAVQWYDFTLAEDGVSFKMPGIFKVDWSAGTFLGAEVNGRLMTYYFILVVSVLLFRGLVQFVESPVGRVLQSVRDNEQRSIALGYKTFRYQILSIILSSSVASMGGVMFAMWLGYVNPESVLATPIMLNILLMVIIGGLGTLYGSVIGSAFIEITQTYLPELQKIAKAVFPQVEMIHRLAERWVLYFGILFVLVVFFFPRGILGTAREMLARRRAL